VDGLGHIGKRGSRLGTRSYKKLARTSDRTMVANQVPRPGSTNFCKHKMNCRIKFEGRLHLARIQGSARLISKELVVNEAIDIPEVRRGAWIGMRRPNGEHT